MWAEAVMSCLVIGNHTQGLGIIRSLADTGLDLHLVNDRLIGLSRFSRYLTKYHILKKDTLKTVYLHENASRLLDFIDHLIPRDAGWPVFCVNEDIVHFLYQHRASFGGRLVVPPNSIMDIIDKYRFAKEMERIGLLTPRTYVLSTFDADLLQKGAYLCKGRIGNRFRNIFNLKGMSVANADDLKSIRSSIRGIISENDILMQEKVHQNSEVLSCCGLSIEGKLYRHFQYVKLRQHPNEFGTGTFLKSIRDCHILDQTRRIMSHFSYTGIFEVEFLRQDDKHIIIEMNPRTWKSVHFATGCGQNMCVAYADYLRKKTVPEKRLDYKVGKTWADLATDVPMLVKNRQWRRTGYDRNTCFCVLSTKDPAPFIMGIVLAPLISLGI